MPGTFLPTRELLFSYPGMYHGTYIMPLSSSWKMITIAIQVIVGPSVNCKVSLIEEVSKWMPFADYFSQINCLELQNNITSLGHVVAWRLYDSKPLREPLLNTWSYVTLFADAYMWHQVQWAHGDVIKWKHFSALLVVCAGIHRSPVNSPHKGQWCGALMFYLICAWINGWVNNHEAGDLRGYSAHYDVSVMWTVKKDSLSRVCT